MTGLSFSELAIVALNIMLLLAVPGAVVVVALVVVRRIRNLEGRVRRLEESEPGQAERRQQTE
jgi:hypothetical protein